VQSIVEDLRLATDASFISIGDAQGVRLAHPKPERIGKPMVGGDNDRALVDAESYISKATGSLGESIRGKTPVFDDKGNVVGVVSVGYLTKTIDQTITRYQRTVIIATLALLLVSIALAIWIARRFRAAIFDLEPHEIASLFLERNATLESIREGVIAINSEGKITTFNKAALNTLRLDESELAGQSLNDILPESRMPQLLNTGEAEYDRETVVNGRKLIINRLPIIQDGKLQGVVASFRPKDELTEVSQKLTRISQYAEALRSQAHEYANKLHTIAGLISLDAKQEALDLIGQETKEHQQLLNWLKDSVADPVVAGCILGKFNRANELGLTLSIDQDSQLNALPNHIESQQMVTLIGNLIDNAFDASIEQKSTEIRLSMTDFGSDIVIEVEDDGVGIPQALMDDLFLSGISSKGDGRGIGLSLIADIINALNGSITVEPGQPQGTRFTLYLPREFKK